MTDQTIHAFSQSEQYQKSWPQDTTSVSFHLKDELHHPQFAWPRTLLSYQLAFERRDIHAEQLRLVDQATGERVVFQLTEVETDGSALKAARLHFFADLPSGHQRLFQLQLVDERESNQASDTWVQVERDDETVVVRSDVLQVRLPCSQEARANAVPGPIMQLNRGQGWIGRATVQSGAQHVLSLETQLLEIGPLFATHQITYLFDKGASYTATVRVIAGSDFVELDEQMQGFEPGAGTSMEIAWGGFSPTHRFSSTWPGSQKATDYAAESGDAEFYRWRAIDDPIVLGYGGEDPAFSGRLRVEQPERDFAFTVGPYAPSYAWNVRPHATFWDTAKAESLGVFIRHPERWDDQTYTIWVSADILQLHFRYTRGILYWTWPLANGTRQTGIAFYDHEKDLQVLREQDNHAQALAVFYDLPLDQALARTRYLTTYTRYLHHWYSTLSLDLVKDWVLSYSGRRPEVIFNMGQIGSSREFFQKLFAGSEGPRLIAQGINELAGYLNIGQRPIYDYFLDGYNRFFHQLTEQQRVQVDALFLLTAYLSAREELAPLVRMLGGHPNFMADGKSVLPCFAWLYPDHPLATEWRDLFETFLTIVGTFHTRPALPQFQARGGRWTESLAVYVWAFLRPMVSGNFLGMLLNGRNNCAQSFLAAVGDWLVNTLSSPIEFQPSPDYQPGVTALTWENGFRRLHPPQGAHSSWPRWPPLEMWMLGQFLRNYRPLIAEHLLWGSDPAAYRLDADASLPDPWRILANPAETNRGTNPHLKSCKYTGYGIILRADVDLPTEMAVVLQQVDRGPNYRWGIGGANSSGTLYYYANGRAYSGHGREESGDRRREDVAALSTFGVWKDGTFRTIGENILERPLYDLEIAQYAEVVASGNEQADAGPLLGNYALPEYRGRSVLLVGSDYIVTYDAIVPGQWCAWSWFSLTKPTGIDGNSSAYLPDQLPFIRAVRGVVQEEGIDYTVQTPIARGMRLESDPSSGDPSNVLVVVSHRADLQVADGAETPWGAQITTLRSIDYVFRYQGEVYYQPEEIYYTSPDGLVFEGTAGLIRLWQDGTKHLALFHGSRIGTLDVSITVDHPDFGVSLVYRATPELAGHYFTARTATLTLNLPAGLENALLYVDGELIASQGTETSISARVLAGQHRWQLTRGLPEPLPPVILRTVNASHGAQIFFTAVAGAEAYEIQASKDQGRNWFSVGTTSHSYFHLRDQQNGVKIHVRVIAVNAHARSRPGDEYPIYVSDAPAPPPDGLRMELARNSISLTWGEVLGVARYHLYRRKAREADFQEIFCGLAFQFIDEQVPGIIPAYPDPGQAANAWRDRSEIPIYEYAIASENGNGVGEKSLPINTDPASWRNWRPVTELKFRRQHAYNQPPYVDKAYTPPLYYDVPVESDEKGNDRCSL